MVKGRTEREWAGLSGHCSWLLRVASQTFFLRLQSETKADASAVRSRLIGACHAVPPRDATGESRTIAPLAVANLIASGYDTRGQARLKPCTIELHAMTPGWQRLLKTPGDKLDDRYLLALSKRLDRDPLALRQTLIDEMSTRSLALLEKYRQAPSASVCSSALCGQWKGEGSDAYDVTAQALACVA